MGRKREILELRERLDKTLALPELTNEESIKSLIKSQVLNSSFSSITGDVDKLLEKRTKEVVNFLQMQRSASENEMNAKRQEAGHIDWKIKQDTDDFRVMYREGPEGSPFHSLLAEGYADGPLDVCLCVSWEANLYKKWFPQYKVPTFKVILSNTLQKVRVGEEISLVRVKVPWPISDREALLHYLEIEYLQEDLILVLMKTISSRDQVDESVDGFSGSVIPDTEDATRIDIVGGFVLQKIDSNKSYFRTIANMDIKLDFVPPWLINFVSRQLIGSGYKLFQKVLGTVATHDEDYLKALEGPMYARVRENLGKRNKSKTAEDSSVNEEPTVLPKESICDSAVEITLNGDNVDYSEIVEEKTEQSSRADSDRLDDKYSCDFPMNDHDHVGQDFILSPEVKHALHILESTISVLRAQKSPENQMNNPSPSTQALLASPNLHTDSSTSDSSADLLMIHSQTKQPDKLSRAELASSSSLVENKIANPEQENVTSGSSQDKLFQNSFTATRPPFFETMNKVCDEDNLEANGFYKQSTCDHKKKHRSKTRLWCFSSTFAKG